MIDNLQLLFVWAPILNVQVILEGIFVGAVFALSAYGTGPRLGRYEYQKPSTG
jgi:hypothetical protein